jgi:DnaJ-class molecular chaperone
MAMEICSFCNGEGSEYDPAHDWWGACTHCEGGGMIEVADE